MFVFPGQGKSDTHIRRYSFRFIEQDYAMYTLNVYADVSTMYIHWTYMLTFTQRIHYIRWQGKRYAYWTFTSSAIKCFPVAACLSFMPSNISHGDIIDITRKAVSHETKYF